MLALAHCLGRCRGLASRPLAASSCVRISRTRPSTQPSRLTYSIRSSASPAIAPPARGTRRCHSSARLGDTDGSSSALISSALFQMPDRLAAARRGEDPHWPSSACPTAATRGRVPPPGPRRALQRTSSAPQRPGVWASFAASPVGRFTVAVHDHHPLTGKTRPARSSGADLHPSSPPPRSGPPKGRNTALAGQRSFNAGRDREAVRPDWLAGVVCRMPPR